MAKAYVKPGACGLESKIVVTRKDGDADKYDVDIHIETESDNVKRLAKVLTEANGLDECFQNFSTSKVYQLGAEVGLHLACPVPCAIIKAIEVECGFALPRNVEITIDRD